jgi:hypothetical protein
MHRSPAQRPNAREWQQRDGDFEDAAHVTWSAITGQQSRPSASGLRMCDRLQRCDAFCSVSGDEGAFEVVRWIGVSPNGPDRLPRRMLRRRHAIAERHSGGGRQIQGSKRLAEPGGSASRPGAQGAPMLRESTPNGIQDAHLRWSWKRGC